jgi:hypothetical protein
VPRVFSHPSRCALGVAAIILGCHFRAAAADEELDPPKPDKIRLEYQAPAECPDAETFKGLVGARAPLGWEAGPGELARRIEVVITSVEDRYVATIELVDEQGERVRRAVRGARCSDVADGIALVTALAIQGAKEDALALSAPASEPLLAQPSSPVMPPAPPAPAPPAAQAARTARAVDESPLGLRASARVGLTSGLGLSLAPGAGVGVVYERWNARIGVAFQGAWTGRVEASGVPARFTLLAARLEGCPYVPVPARWVALEPCPFAELGAVTGEAFAAPPGVSRGFPGSALWISAGGAGRLVGQFGALAVELEALVGAPLRRERFYVENGVQVHRLPAFYGSVAAGLGVRF